MNLSDTDRLEIWEKGFVDECYDPAMYRRDAYGTLMKWTSYGKITSLGWEADHIYPKSRGGSNAVWNLRPLNWLNNRIKQDDILALAKQLGVEHLI